MAITIHESQQGEVYQIATGITHGNEKVFRVMSDRGGWMHAILTSGPGTATPKGSLEDEWGTDLTDFGDLVDDAQTATFLKAFGPGARWMTLDIGSSSGGTWTVIIRQPNRI